MREIKFRAWDTETKEMSYDFLSKNWLLVCIESPYVELMQYTGLKDKNGKEIYEGDIVKMTYHKMTGYVHDGTDTTFDGHHLGEVVITARGAFLRNPLHYSEDTDETHRMNFYKQIAGYRSEVIGNIYETPELIGRQATETTESA